MKRLFLGLSLLLAFALVMTGCSGGGSGSSSSLLPSSPQPATVFITGGDAPLPSVLAFRVTINSMTLANATTSASLISEPTEIEFSRLLGLRTLLGLNSVPAGTYTTVTYTLATPVISYLDLTTNPASVGTINGTLTQSTITMTLPQPLVVGENGLGGLHFHFDLRDSLRTDSVTHELTGTVDPHIQIRALTVNDDDAQVDELRGGLVSVNAAGNSFVLQRIHGRQITIKVNSSTTWDGTDTINTITAPALIEVSGKIQADGSLLADTVQVVTRDAAFVSGLVLSTTPASGAADSVTLLVRQEMPDLAGIDVGKTGTLAITNTTRFDIYKMALPVDILLFGRDKLIRGQRVAVGGTINSTTNPPSLDTRRVVLHRQGIEGVVVPGSFSVNNGVAQFDLNATGVFGYLFGGPIHVVTSANPKIVNMPNLPAIGTQGGTPIYVMGLLLKDPNTGNPTFVAGLIGKSVTAN